MTQLGELTAIGLVDTKNVECPFHEKKHDCSTDAENVYREGNAETLGKNLAKGKQDNSSTVFRAKGSPDHDYRANRKEDDPDEDSEKDREIGILDGDDDCIYPVAFAAHHLIPGKASMGKAKALHKYIRKGEICCNLGYSVDGNENGVWLPGLHAVNSNGLNLWSGKVASRSLPDKEDVRNISKVKARMRKELEPSANGKRSKFAYKPITGPTPGDAGAQAFRSDNMKWLYVKGSMAYLGARQFHDAHPAYSSLVVKQLGAVAQRVATLLENAKKTGPTQCPECKKRQDAGKKPTPPLALLGLLNNTSSWYRAKLVGKTSDKEYYTSSWCGPLAKVKPRSKPKKKAH